MTNIILNENQSLGAKCTAGLFFFNESIDFIDTLVKGMGGVISTHSFEESLKAFLIISHLRGLTSVEDDLQIVLRGGQSVVTEQAVTYARSHPLFFEEQIEGYGALCLITLGLYAQIIRDGHMTIHE